MISFIFVIVIHVSNYYCRAYGDITIGEYSFSLLLNLLARISVPCFFMITGALLLGRQESLHKHAKRIFRFLIVLLVWSVIYMIWNAVYMKDPYQIKDLLYKPVEQHLWYLYAMIPIYLVLPFFQVMCKGMNLRMERAFLVVITAAVLFNYISTFFDEKMYYSVPMVGDRIYSYYVFMRNQRIIAGNAQFTGIAAGRGVGFTTGLLLLRKGLGMRETPIRPHSWHCRMQSGYQYGGNRKRPPVWRRHRGSLRPRGRNLGGVEGMTGGCGSGCDPAIHTRRLRVYHRPRRLRMASRISIFFAARRFEPLNSMG